MRGGGRFELHLSDRVQAEAFLMRRYEPALVEFISRRLPAAGGVVLDVGAHVGLIALQVAARRAAGAVKLHAFEPSAANVARLRRNIELNPGSAIQVVHAAVTEGSGTAQLATSPGGTDLAGSRLVAPAGRVAAATEVVPTVSLDGYAAEQGLDRVDVVKLDVEGSELSALGGAEWLLAERRIGCVICELNDIYLAERSLERRDVTAPLERAGYRQVPIAPVGAQRLRHAPRESAVVDVAFTVEGQ